MDKGKVKFYNREKKYGFITGDDGKDYFFHVSGVSNEAELNDEDAVEFKVEDGERGPKAVEISPLQIFNLSLHSQRRNLTTPFDDSFVDELKQLKKKPVKNIEDKVVLSDTFNLNEVL